MTTSEYDALYTSGHASLIGPDGMSVLRSLLFAARSSDRMASANYDDVANATGLSRRSVARIIRALTGDGYLKKAIAGKGKAASVYYVLTYKEIISRSSANVTPLVRRSSASLTLLDFGSSASVAPLELSLGYSTEVQGCGGTEKEEKRKESTKEKKKEKEDYESEFREILIFYADLIMAATGTSRKIAFRFSNKGPGYVGYRAKRRDGVSLETMRKACKIAASTPSWNGTAPWIEDGHRIEDGASGLYGHPKYLWGQNKRWEDVMERVENEIDVPNPPPTFPCERNGCSGTMEAKESKKHGLLWVCNVVIGHWDKREEVVA